MMAALTFVPSRWYMAVWVQNVCKQDMKEHFVQLMIVSHSTYELKQVGKLIIHFKHEGCTLQDSVGPQNNQCTYYFIFFILY